MVFLGIDEIEVFRNLFYWLSTLLYELIKPLYDIFERLCNSRILDTEVLRTISDRIGLVLAIVMFFIVTFSVIQLLIEPDKITDKEKGVGKIVMKVLLVIGMLAFHNIAFSALYGLQKEVLETNIIQKFILPYEVETEYFGGVLTKELFTSFYSINSEVTDQECEEYFDILENNIVYFNDYSAGKVCLNKKNGDTYVMNFNVLLLPIVGAVALYFVFSYCISVGIRTIQLAFLEIISPMAIVSYLSPKKETMFQKWWKLYFSTYIDVFLRVAIINLAVFLIAVIFSSDFQGTFLESVEIGETRTFSDNIIIIIIIMALLTFAKKAPDLLKDLFPNSGSKLGLGIGSPKKMFSDMLFGNTIQKATTWGAKAATAGTAIGLINGLTSGISRYQINKKNGRTTGQAVMGAVGGVLGGFGRGIIAGGKKGNVFANIPKGIKEQRNINDKYDELITSGGSTFGKLFSGITSYVGETKGQTYTRYLNDLDKMAQYKKDMNAAADEISFVKSAKDAWESVVQWQGETLESYENRKSEAGTRYRKLRNAAVDAALNGKATVDFSADVKDAKTGKVVIAKGAKYEFSEDSDNTMYTTDIVSTLTQAESYRISHKVKYWDDAKNDYVELETFVDPTTGNFDRTKLSDASNFAHTTKTKITGQEEYNKAIANDKAAGVNSNGSGKK